MKLARCLEMWLGHFLQLVAKRFDYMHQKSQVWVSPVVEIPKEGIS